MSTFAAKMAEYKRNKADCRRRGRSVGDHRGQLRERPMIDRDMDPLERDIAMLVQRTFIDPLHAFQEDLHWIVICLNDWSIAEVPF